MPPNPSSRNDSHTKVAQVKAYLERRDVRQIIESVLPRDRSITHDMIVRLTVMACKGSSKLAECQLDSLANCAIEAAALGLQPGGSLAECRFVPFKGRATFMLGYPGMIALARRSGEVIDITTGCVCRGDVFEYDLGTARTLRHRKGDDREESVITHAYAHAVLVGGINKIEVMTSSELAHVRSVSSGYRMAEADKAKQSDSPYHQWPDEMSRKAPLRRMFKTLARSREMQRAYDLDTQSEIGDQQDFGRTIELPSPAQLAADDATGAIEEKARRVVSGMKQSQQPAQPTSQPSGWRQGAGGGWVMDGDHDDDPPDTPDAPDDIPPDDVPAVQLVGHDEPTQPPTGQQQPVQPRSGMPPMVARFFNRITAAPNMATLDKIAVECRDCKDAMMPEHVDMLRETFLTKKARLEGDGA